MKSVAIFVILALAGCASYKSYNQRTAGKVKITGGIYQKESWSDSLLFTRMSWYHGMTLYFDTLVWKADPTSPFSKWFSSSEKEYFTKCENILVTIAYSADPTKISHVNFREQMKLNGYDDVVMNNFASYIKSHPSLNDWRMANYRVMGYCKRSPSRFGSEKLVMNFPSFKHLELKLNDN